MVGCASLHLLEKILVLEYLVVFLSFFSVHNRYPLKSLYLMEGPSDREWVEKFPLTYTRDVVSTTPWSVKARIKGELFGFMWKYR